MIISDVSININTSAEVGDSMEDKLVGKKAYKKYGFFSYLIGVIEKNPTGITPYMLCGYHNGERYWAVGFNSEKDIVIVEGEVDD